MEGSSRGERARFDRPVHAAAEARGATTSGARACPLLSGNQNYRAAHALHGYGTHVSVESEPLPIDGFEFSLGTAPMAIDARRLEREALLSLNRGPYEQRIFGPSGRFAVEVVHLVLVSVRGCVSGLVTAISPRSLRSEGSQGCYRNDGEMRGTQVRLR